ncbi:MAG: 1,4-alpha-glucan branching protein domain-containing protein [Verrucomicrobiota bacterium]
MNRHSAIVLHAHVPWVRNPSGEWCLEEDWFFQNTVESYLPLFERLFQMREEGTPWALTIDFSPTLLAMLQDRIMIRRLLSFFDRTIKLAEAEMERHGAGPEGDLAEFYRDRYRRLRRLFVESFNCDLVGALIDLRDSGHLEITSSAATHGLLPLLLRVPESVRTQIRAGMRSYVDVYQRTARGFWLPECAMAPALGKVLKDEGFQWTIIEQHGMTHAHNADERFPHTPGVTTDGLIIFGRCSECSSQVWHGSDGYPADPRYREFLRDVGHEAPIENLQEFLGDNQVRRFTGLKYYSKTGETHEKDLYDAEKAAMATEEHSVHFLNSVGAQLAEAEAEGTKHPIAVCAFDAELFGHWWFEGVDFLEAIFKRGADRPDFKFSHISEYLDTPDLELPNVTPTSSSWGEGGYFETWMTDQNNWIYPELKSRGDNLARMVKMFIDNRGIMPDEKVDHRKTCLSLLSKELLMAQSSDWGFLMNNEASADFAKGKVQKHLDAFDQIWEVCTSFGDLSAVEPLKAENPIFNDLPWDMYEPISS